MRTLIMLVFCSVLWPLAASAQYQCGQVLLGGTRDVPRRHTLTRDMYCSTPIGLRLSQSHTILDCQGHSINRWGSQGGQGVRMGGSTLSTTAEQQHVINCTVRDWNIGIANYYSNTTLIESSIARSNGQGIVISNTFFTTLLNVHTPGNDNDGIRMFLAYRPGVANCSANSNGDRGIYMNNVTEPLFINSQARRNGDPDLYFHRTTQGFLYGGIYDSMLFTTTSFNNHWCQTVLGRVVGAGATNFPWCP